VDSHVVGTQESSGWRWWFGTYS